MTTHADLEYAVDDESGREHTFTDFGEACAFAVEVAIARGEADLDVLVFSEEGARVYGGDDAAAEFNEDPEASVFERFEISVNNVGRVP